MLFRNEERVKLTDEQIKEFKSTFSGFPLILMYSPEVYRERPGSDDAAMDSPESVQVPCVESVATDRGVDVWRYAENIVNRNNQVVYMPRTINFTGHMVLQEKDIELAWYLFNCSSTVKHGKNASKVGRVYLMFRDAEKEAKKDVSDERQVNRIRNLIFNDAAEGGLGNKKITQIAKSYFISGADNKSTDELRNAIFRLVAGQRDGFEEFMEVAKVDETVIIKARIQSAVDKGILKFIYKGRGWWYFNSDGVKVGTTSIINIAPNVKAEEGLYKHFVENSMALEEFNLAIGVTTKVVEDAD